MSFVKEFFKRLVTRLFAIPLLIIFLVRYAVMKAQQQKEKNNDPKPE